MMKKVLVAFCVLLALCPNAFPQRRSTGVTIKVASLVPENTPWGDSLKKMAAQWAAASNGEVQMIVYHGTQGSEEEILRKLNINALQGAMFTSFGFNKIAPETLTLSCPFLIRTDGELAEVLRTVMPEIEGRINAGNYQSLAIVRGGWIKFFSRDPVFLPADLKRQKVTTPPSEPAMAQAFRAMGYQVVMNEESEVLIKLNARAIDALYNSPMMVAAAQYFGVAKNMASINVAPFLGGLILNRRAWESIPEQYRARIKAITQQIGREFEASLAKLEADSIAVMLRNGLTQNTVTPAQAEAWYADIARAVPSLLGSTFDRATYNKIEAILQDFRRRQ